MGYGARVLTWSEVRPLVVTTLGRSFVSLGFPNPGRGMWRVRPRFTDVAAFRCAKYGRSLKLELACALRRKGLSHPYPEECEFRVDLAPALGWTEERFLFRDSVPEQVEALESMVPDLVAFAETWFAKWDCVSKAIEAVEASRGAECWRRGEGIDLRALPRLRALPG